MSEDHMNEEVVQRIITLKRTIRHNPDDAWAHCCLGVCYEKLGLFNRAVEVLNRAIRLAPVFPLALRRLGSIYGRLGLTEEGRKLVEHADILEYSAKQKAKERVQRCSELFDGLCDNSTGDRRIDNAVG